MNTLSAQLKNLVTIDKETKLNTFVIVDGNTHQTNLLSNNIQNSKISLLSESLIPEIRALACLIATDNYKFIDKSPNIFTHEEDWFAARILILKARIFTLDLKYFPILNKANKKAQKFAKKYNLDFKPAKAKLTININRPKNILIFESSFSRSRKDNGIIKNTAIFRKNLAKLPFNL